MQVPSAIPKTPEALVELGQRLSRDGQIESAVLCFERAVDLVPLDFGLQTRLAAALKDRGELDRAIGHYQCALLLEPKSVPAHLDLATALRMNRRLAAAIAIYRRALAIDPKSALAHNNLGVALLDDQRLDEAIEALRRAALLAPEFAAAHTNLGNSFAELGLIEEAVKSYRRAVEADRDDHDAHSNLVYALSFHAQYDARGILEAARAWAARHAAPLSDKIVAHANDRDPERRLRIGYVSPDFRDHCQALFMTPLLSNHDRGRFEIFCYASVQNPDGVTEALRARADHFRNLLGVDDIAAANVVRSDGIDVLVDLTMHMAHNRLRTFACKPAPVQVSWLAYPGTTGLSTIDYRVTDRFIDPPGDAGVYAERSIALPDTFWCYDSLATGIDVGPLPAETNGYVTFGCLNNFCKINANVLSLWARVLSDVEASRLVLLAPAGEARRRTAEFLERKGIARTRVSFVSRQARTGYLSVYRQIDVCLDSFPYNGHTTSLDSFWMGVPVVTLVGKTVVGRAGYCQAMNLGMPELVAHSDDEYVRIASNLARDKSRLAEMRAGLRERMEGSPLMDAPRFARNLERAFRTMWRAWCAGDAS